VLFYAVAVFASFMMGLLAMARFSWQEKNYRLLTVNVIAAIAVFFTLVINLGRGYPLASFAALGIIAGGLYRAWIKAGRPEGVTELEQTIEGR
jgi:Na+-transporting methylmalonyl-CoA/oxaloacetate decarboxylase beta subunit